MVRRKWPRLLEVPARKTRGSATETSRKAACCVELNRAAPTTDRHGNKPQFKFKLFWTACPSDVSKKEPPWLRTSSDQNGPLAYADHPGPAFNRLRAQHRAETKQQASPSMSTKVEAKRFSGKPGQWPHYELSLRAHFAINDLAKHFNGGQRQGRKRRRQR